MSIIDEYEPELETFSKITGYLPTDFEAWHEEERIYLQNVNKGAVGDADKIQYVKELQALDNLRSERKTQGEIAFRSYTDSDFSSGSLPTSSITSDRATEVARTKTHLNLLLVFNRVEELETRLKIQQRWTSDDQEYKDSENLVRHKDFLVVVEELEGRVVQRIFELSKANLAGTGYKLRRQISKNIARRSQALRTSLDKYNVMAPKQDPPRPIIDYKDIANYAWLGDFDLLKHSRHDILSRPWSQTRNREFAVKHHKLKRAREEMIRVNVEARRLQEWVDMEDEQLKQLGKGLIACQPLLAAEIRGVAVTQLRVNEMHRRRLRMIYALGAYSGPGVGSRGSYTIIPSTALDSPGVFNTDSMYEDEELTALEVILPDEDDFLDEELTRLEDVLRSNRLV